MISVQMNLLGLPGATLEQIAARFGQITPERQELMQSLLWLVEMCKRDDVLRLVVNGSFVTSNAASDAPLTTGVGSQFSRGCSAGSVLVAAGVRAIAGLGSSETLRLRRDHRAMKFSGRQPRPFDKVQNISSSLHVASAIAVEKILN